MTRLTEALERARAFPKNGPETAEPDKGDGGVAAAWDFAEAAAEPFDALLAAPPARAAKLAGPAVIEPTPVEAKPAAPRPALLPEAISPADVAPDLYHFSLAASDKVVVGSHADSGLVEQYRRLAAVLHNAQLRDGVRSVMIASAVAAEGKTLTATNLALTLSHSYQRRVLLIDADLRRPSVHQVFQLPNHDGLGNSLRNATGGALPVQRLSSTLWVLTAGPSDSDPMSSLVSDAMKHVLADAADQFDWVIVDTPPVALMPDANLLASMIDAGLLVVSANTTPYPLVKRATDAIGASKILGVVLNRADKSAMADGYGYYGYYYSYYAKPQQPAPSRWSPFRFFRSKKAS
jgi:protein-tyrosine kinase